MQETWNKFAEQLTPWLSEHGWRVLAILISLLILAFNASFVIAAPPSSLHIVVEETIVGGSEAFVASGAAVDNNLVCQYGQVVEIGESSSNNPGGPFKTIWVTKQFDCGDGTFDVKMVIKLDLDTGNTTANWKITSGTGNYVNLKGSGKLVGTPGDPGEIIDVYDGKVH